MDDISSLMWASIINRDSIRKAGVILAYATEEFRKESR